MAELARLSFTIEKPLLKRLERLMREARYKNRSEYIRDLIRAKLVGAQWEKDTEALGTITLIYDHDTRQLSDKLTTLQHKHHHAVLATTHVHLDNHMCAEMIMVKARAHVIRELAEAMGQQKGVLHSDLTMSSTGKQLR